MEDRARQYLICQEWVSQVKSRRVKLKSRQAKSSHGKVRQERCKRDRSMTIVTVKYVLAHRHDLCVTWSSSVSSRHPLHDVSHGVPRGSVIGIVPSEKDDTQPWNSRSNIIDKAWAEYLWERERVWEIVWESESVYMSEIIFVCVREGERGRERECVCERENEIMFVCMRESVCVCVCMWETERDKM